MQTLLCFGTVNLLSQAITVHVRLLCLARLGAILVRWQANEGPRGGHADVEDGHPRASSEVPYQVISDTEGCPSSCGCSGKPSDQVGHHPGVVNLAGDIRVHRESQGSL